MSKVITELVLLYHDMARRAQVVGLVGFVCASIGKKAQARTEEGADGSGSERKINQTVNQYSR
jgi:hypothetical protein